VPHTPQLIIPRGPRQLLIRPISDGHVSGSVLVVGGVCVSSSTANALSIRDGCSYGNGWALASRDGRCVTASG